jgi:hypothetical protein
MGDGWCMGLFLRFFSCPAPLVDRTDDGLAALIDVDMLHRHLLLALAAVPLQRLHLHRVGPQQLHREISIRVLLLDDLRGLELPQVPHRRRMYCDHLRREHTLDLAARSDTVHRREHTVNVRFCERMRLATAPSFEKLGKVSGIEVFRSRAECHEVGHPCGFGLALGARNVDRLTRPMNHLHSRSGMPRVNSFAKFGEQIFLRIIERPIGFVGRVRLFCLPDGASGKHFDAVMRAIRLSGLLGLEGPAPGIRRVFSRRHSSAPS